MQWDRIVMMVVGLVASLFTGYFARRDWRKGRYLAVAGALVAMLAAIAVPAVLAVFVP